MKSARLPACCQKGGGGVDELANKGDGKDRNGQGELEAKQQQSTQPQQQQ